jgi:hypothetical protein
MLRQENVLSPGELTFDKPSAMMLSFLSKQYGLSQPINQTNNFVVFPEYFGGAQMKNRAKFLQQTQPHRRPKTHYDSTGIASILSNPDSEPPDAPAPRIMPKTRPEAKEPSPIPAGPQSVSDILRNAECYRHEDIEALRLSEDNLSQINKKIGEREATIARIECELRQLEGVKADVCFEIIGLVFMSSFHHSPC